MPTSTSQKTKKSQQEAKKLSFADRANQTYQTQNQWQDYNTTARFYGKNMQKSLEILGKKTFPKDEVNSKGYQQAIVKSLVETLNKEIGIKDFWQRMSEAGCKELKIENGHLSFYADQNQKIDITNYTKPIVFDLHSSFYKQRKLERKQRIEEAKQQLEELMREINESRSRKKS
jgi:hypothetical protein